MRTVRQYSLKPGLNKIEMPSDAEVLTAQIKGDTPGEWPQLWALVEDAPAHARTVRAFYVAATGEDLDALPLGLASAHVGTVQAKGWPYGPSLVFHVFDISEHT